MTNRLVGLRWTVSRGSRGWPGSDKLVPVELKSLLLLLLLLNMVLGPGLLVWDDELTAAFDGVEMEVTVVGIGE